MSAKLTARKTRNRITCSLVAAGQALDRIEARGLDVRNLDDEGRAAVGAFVDALAGRVWALRKSLNQAAEADAGSATTNTANGRRKP